MYFRVVGKARFSKGLPAPTSGVLNPPLDSLAGGFLRRHRDTAGCYTRRTPLCFPPAILFGDHE